MSAPTRSQSLVLLAVVLAASTIGAWWWRSRIFRTPYATVNGDAWDQVKADYPLIQDPAPIAQLAPEAVDAVVSANPFSAERRRVPPPADGQQEGGSGAVEAPAPKGPQFAYKGRLTLGRRQRAIVEDLHGGKTHFLEVGQEVAGFKVLDIAENRVVLSNLKSQEDVVVPLATTASP